MLTQLLLILLSFDSKWVLVETPALLAYAVFVIETAVVSMLTCGFIHVSNHAILSIDILYLASTLILALYHMFKGSPLLPCR